LYDKTKKNRRDNELFEFCKHHLQTRINHLQKKLTSTYGIYWIGIVFELLQETEWTQKINIQEIRKKHVIIKM